MIGPSQLATFGLGANQHIMFRLHPSLADPRVVEEVYLIVVLLVILLVHHQNKVGNRLFVPPPCSTSKSGRIMAPQDRSRQASSREAKMLLRSWFVGIAASDLVEPQLAPLMSDFDLAI